MTDTLNEQQRHYNMSRIRSKDTKPEEIVRKYLFSKGLRFRKNDRRYPGHPDVMLPKYKTVVFVNGCFWHWHEGCRYASTPATNREFWNQKLERNVERDARKQKELREIGWNVIVVWECELKKAARGETLERLYHEITDSEKE